MGFIKDLEHQLATRQRCYRRNATSCGGWCSRLMKSRSSAQPTLPLRLQRYRCAQPNQREGPKGDIRALCEEITRKMTPKAPTATVPQTRDSDHSI
jgi:hypothetical protein